MAAMRTIETFIWKLRIDKSGGRRKFAAYAIFARRSAKADLHDSAANIRIIVHITHHRDTLIRHFLWFPSTALDAHKTRVFQLVHETLRRASCFDGMIWQDLPHLRSGTH